MVVVANEQAGSAYLMCITNDHWCDGFTMGGTRIITSVIGLCQAGVAVVSIERVGSKSWDIVSPMRLPVSAG
jgi:hypothetical protein